jgi:hypothetical protein
VVVATLLEKSIVPKLLVLEILVAAGWQCFAKEALLLLTVCPLSTAAMDWWLKPH